MNEISDKFLLAGDKLIPEMHLRRPGFTNTVHVCHLQKRKKEHKNF